MSSWYPRSQAYDIFGLRKKVGKPGNEARCLSYVVYLVGV